MGVAEDLNSLGLIIPFRTTSTRFACSPCGAHSWSWDIRRINAIPITPGIGHIGRYGALYAMGNKGHYPGGESYQEAKLLFWHP